jgi:phosphate uptake regulator
MLEMCNLGRHMINRTIAPLTSLEDRTTCTKLKFRTFMTDFIGLSPYTNLTAFMRYLQRITSPAWNMVYRMTLSYASGDNVRNASLERSDVKPESKSSQVEQTRAAKLYEC